MKFRRLMAFCLTIIICVGVVPFSWLSGNNVYAASMLGSTSVNCFTSFKVADKLDDGIKDTIQVSWFKDEDEKILSHTVAFDYEVYDKDNNMIGSAWLMPTYAYDGGKDRNVQVGDIPRNGFYVLVMSRTTLSSVNRAFVSANLITGEDIKKFRPDKDVVIPSIFIGSASGGTQTEYKNVRLKYRSLMHGNSSMSTNYTKGLFFFVNRPIKRFWGLHRVLYVLYKGV